MVLIGFLGSGAINQQNCLCLQVQHLGTRGQHFGPPSGSGLRREVSVMGITFVVVLVALLIV